MLQTRLRALNLRSLKLSLTKLAKDLSQANALTILNLQAVEDVVTSFTDFTCPNLAFLNISAIGLVTADFTGMPQLTEVIAHSNSFTSLAQFATKPMQLVDLESN